MTLLRRSLVLLSAVSSLLLPVAFAQIIPNNLPPCAQTCPLLQQAQQSCESNPSAALSCFCQSALLAQLQGSTSTNICAPQCDGPDFVTIGTWYKSTCANGGANQAPGVSTTLAVVTVTAAGQPPGQDPTTPTAAAAAATTAASSSSSEDINDDESGPSWWDNHWKWVLMVIILAVAFAVIGIVGSILFKRYKRKRDGIITANPRERRPEIDEWAPNRHSVHDFSQGAPTHDPAMAPPLPGTAAAVPKGSAKGKEREVVADGAPLKASRSKRLRKSII